MAHRGRKLSASAWKHTPPYLCILTKDRPLCPTSWNHLANTITARPENSLGTVLGSTVWHSFIGGPIAYLSLPRQQFGHLQSRLFPRFFALQSLSALALLGLYSRRPGGGELVRTFWRHGNKTVWALVVMASSGFANWLFVGPLTTGV